MRMFLLYQQQVSLDVEELHNENKLFIQKKAKLSSEVESLHNNLNLTTNDLNGVFSERKCHMSLKETKEKVNFHVLEQNIILSLSGTSSTKTHTSF